MLHLLKVCKVVKSCFELLADILTVPIFFHYDMFKCFPINGNFPNWRGTFFVVVVNNYSYCFPNIYVETIVSTVSYCWMIFG